MVFLIYGSRSFPVLQISFRNFIIFHVLKDVTTDFLYSIFHTDTAYTIIPIEHQPIMLSGADSKSSKFFSDDDESHGPKLGRTWYWLCATAISSLLITYMYCSGHSTLITYAGVDGPPPKEVRHGQFRNLSIKEESESVCMTGSHFHEIGNLDFAHGINPTNDENQENGEFSTIEGTCAADKLE